jgi:hypothetical protein
VSSFPFQSTIFNDMFAPVKINEAMGSALDLSQSVGQIRASELSIFQREICIPFAHFRGEIMSKMEFDLNALTSL